MVWWRDWLATALVVLAPFVPSQAHAENKPLLAPDHLLDKMEEVNVIVLNRTPDVCISGAEYLEGIAALAIGYNGFKKVVRMDTFDPEVGVFILKADGHKTDTRCVITMEILFLLSTVSQAGGRKENSYIFLDSNVYTILGNRLELTVKDYILNTINRMLLEVRKAKLRESLKQRN